MIRVVSTVFLLLLSTAIMSAEDYSNHDAVLADVTAEELVYDASWSSHMPAVLVVRVFDNGRRRDAYAGYLCMILGEHGITDATVNVVDVVSKKREVIGSAVCRELSR